MTKAPEGAGREAESLCLAAALDYLARGWSVVPVVPRAKRPMVPWRAFQKRRPREDEVRKWFTRWPDANVSVVTGALSGLVVLDVDPRHGGAQALAAIETRHGALPQTVESVTGGGGRHVYFAHPGGEVRNRVGLAPGIDLRGDGGTIVAPPSIHPSGNPYRWRAGHGPAEMAPAPLPAWLLAPRFAGRAAGGGADWCRALFAHPLEGGARQAVLAAYARHLLAHDVDPDVALELLLAWNHARARPPLADGEIIAALRRAEAAGGGR